jgi:SAM-dependent methyltransferase
MLQLRTLNRALVPSLLATAAAPGESLEARADRLVARLREQRYRIGQESRLPTRLAVTVDRWLRTDASEFLDRPDCPAARKVDIVTRLDRVNRLLRAYPRFLAALRPGIDAVYARERRPVRVLELASGSGDFTLALAALAQRQRLPVEVHGSDYLDAHVEAGRRKAAARGLDVGFRNINAFDMQDVAAGEFDLVFVAQTMHHFTPGQLAMMVEQASRKAAYGFVGLDVQRSLHVFGSVPGMALLNPDYAFLHDAVISIRKMYSEPELELIARLAAPAHQVRTYSRLPGYSVLEVLRR